MEKSVNLLCAEDFLRAGTQDDDCIFDSIGNDFSGSDNDDDFLLRCLVDKEVNHLPEKGYSRFVQENESVAISRSRAVSWILRSQTRMNLSVGTVFTATNYLDRFISLTRCQGRQRWMFELLAVACLTVASKLSETTAHPLQDFQMEGQENAFAPSLIQRMELTLLKTLGWRIDSTTPFSYIHLLVKSIDGTLVGDFTKHVTRRLLGTLSDPSFLDFRPCIVTVSAIRCTFQDMFPSKNGASLEQLGAIIPQNLKGDLVRCQSIMREKKLMEVDKDANGSALIRFAPTSPVTVLRKEMFESDGDCNAMGFPPMKMEKDGKPSTRTSRKRKRGEE